MRDIAHAIGKDNIVPRHNSDLGIDRSDRYQPKEETMGSGFQVDKETMGSGFQVDKLGY